MQQKKYKIKYTYSSRDDIKNRMNWKFILKQWLTENN